jgi:two-component system, NarL family, nitrate/nitrite response regulator NarL
MAFLSKEEKCSVLLVDDHEGFRHELRSLLAKDDEIEVIGDACDGAQALKFLTSCEPHVVILDLNMPGMSGIEAAGVIKKSWPKVEIIGLCVMQDSFTMAAFLKAGATAVLSKSDKPEQLHSAIKRVCPRRSSAA